MQWGPRAKIISIKVNKIRTEERQNRYVPPLLKLVLCVSPTTDSSNVLLRALVSAYDCHGVL